MKNDYAAMSLEELEILRGKYRERDERMPVALQLEWAKKKSVAVNAERKGRTSAPASVSADADQHEVNILDD